MMAWYLILPLVFYSLATVIVMKILPFQPLISEMFAAAAAFLVLYRYPYRHEQARRGIVPPIPLRFKRCLPFVLLMGIGICLFVNNIISLTPLPELSAGYQAVSEELYSTPFLFQILGAGFVIPAAEEMIFRGLMFATLRERLGFWKAAALSAAVFGIDHGNLLQGIYAFLLGLVLAWLYERFQTLAAPWGFHVAANLTSLIVTNTAFSILSDVTKKAIFYPAIVLAAILSVLCFNEIKCKMNIKEEKT